MKDYTENLEHYRLHQSEDKLSWQIINVETEFVVMAGKDFAMTVAKAEELDAKWQGATFYTVYATDKDGDRMMLGRAKHTPETRAIFERSLVDSGHTHIFFQEGDYLTEYTDGMQCGRRHDHVALQITPSNLATLLGYENKPLGGPTPERAAFVIGYCAGFKATQRALDKA